MEIIKQKYDNVSICKALAIILMVLGHTGFSHSGNAIIYMFHMPLFVFMSGYCFKEKYINEPKAYLIGRIKRLYIPFVIWSLIFLALHNLFYHWNLYNDTFGYNGSTSHLYSLSDFFRHTAQIILFHGSEQLLGGFWFIKALFWGSTIAYILLKLLKKAGRCILISLVATFLIIHFNFHIPYLLIGKPEIYCSFFFLCGKYYKEKEFKFENNPIVILLLAATVLAGSKWWPASLTDVTDATLLPYSISALAGTLFCLGISHYITTIKQFRAINRFLLFIGNNTLDILALHFISFKVVSLIIIKIYRLDIAHLAEFPIIGEFGSNGWWVAYLLIGIFLPL